MNELGNENPIFKEAKGAKKFFDLLRATNTPLYDRRDKGDTTFK